jgi:Transposase DDE domain
LLGLVCSVKDWYIVDSTTVTVRDAMREEFPGTGDYAAIKVHKVLSVGCGAPVHYHFSSARERDSRHLEIDASWQGCGLLDDLAYASRTRLRACDAQQVCFVIRLKENWKPKQEENGSTQMYLQQHGEQTPERPEKEGGKKWDEPWVPEPLPSEEDSHPEDSVERRGDQPDGRSEHRGPQPVREVNGAYVERV